MTTTLKRYYDGLLTSGRSYSPSIWEARRDLQLEKLIVTVS